jgi:hypothetical protein
MSMKPSAPRIPLARAEIIAEATRAALAPYCDRIAIAGSVRRRRPMVGDLEMVCTPKVILTGLFGDELITDPHCCAVVNQWPAVKGKPEGKYTQRRLPDGIMLDLFMADVENWGLIVASRTGSADLSRHILATGWVQTWPRPSGSSSCLVSSCERGRHPRTRTRRRLRPACPSSGAPGHPSAPWARGRTRKCCQGWRSPPRRGGGWRCSSPLSPAPARPGPSAA